jgi:hypothetical protein
MGLLNPSPQDSSPDRPFHPTPISLTLRDQNIIRAPLRTSSLKLPTIGLRVSKHAKLSHCPYSQTKSPEILSQSNVLPRDAPLKVFKTRNSGGMVTSDIARYGTPGQIANASSRAGTAMDVHEKIFRRGENTGPLVTGSDCVSSNHQLLKNRSAHSWLPNLASSETDVTSESSLDSRPSTSMSSISIDPRGQNQQPQRHHSVRRVVTKAFSNLSKKKKSAVPVEKDLAHDFGQRRTLSQSDTSISFSSCSHDVKLPPRDSAISVTSDIWQDRFSPILSPLRALKSYCEIPRAEELDIPVRKRSDGLCVKPISPTLIVHTPASPSPPGSSITSQFTSGHSHPHRRDEPPPSAVLRVRLAVKPELKRAEFLSKETVWAAVQIHGEMVHRIPPAKSNPLPSLAVAVILDNSSGHLNPISFLLRTKAYKE